MKRVFKKSFIYLPNEILAMRAERRLLEKSGHKLMVFDVVNVFLLEGPLTSALEPLFEIIAALFIFG